MSNQIFVLSISCIGLLGLALTVHLIFFGKSSFPAKMLGWYTFLLTLSSAEPLKEYLDATKYLAEVIIATGSFMIGPVLFLYCKYRLQNRSQWMRIDSIHFLPAGILLVLMAAAPPSALPEQQSGVDIFLYLIFLCHLFAYTLVAFFRVWREKNQRAPECTLQQFHLTFILFLVISSLILFVFSVGSTVVGFNDSFHFKLSVQAFLTMIIIVIVLLNAETLEDHGLRRKAARSYEQK